LDFIQPGIHVHFVLVFFVLFFLFLFLKFFEFEGLQLEVGFEDVGLHLLFLFLDSGELGLEGGNKVLFVFVGIDGFSQQLFEVSDVGGLF
jgi:hypothetical protein